MTDKVTRDHPYFKDPTIANFLARHPGQAADVTLTAGEKVFYALLFFSLGLLATWDWWRSSHLLYMFYGFYIAVVLFRLLSVGLALIGRPEIHLKPGDLQPPGSGGWPFYTVLVPLYKEPEVAAKTVHYLNRLDYPRDRLEVLLLLEQDDVLTRRALAREQLPPYFRVLEVPDSQPRTKPKACNWGLRDARGEFLVIYDAEDRPDPDQLKKAAVAFSRMPDEVICLQAKLSYYNPDQNLLTRWFTIEYAAWFDLYLPGLYRLKFPIPLGGTSNHFRRGVLEEIGGWDPFNVAEDCDLGIRLHRMGYRTAMLDTTTWEEANSRLRNWVRQRSRWVKGYLQTHLVHTRLPLRALRELGPMGALSFLMSVGGHSFLLLVNPIFWIIALVYLMLAGRQIFAGRRILEIVASPIAGPAWGGLFGGMTGSSHLQQILAPILYAVTAILFLANFLFIIFNLLGCFKRRLGLVYLLLGLASPIYWVLISIAAWKGFVQLLRRPHYWEKTDHGLYHEPDQLPQPAATTRQLQ